MIQRARTYLRAIVAANGAFRPILFQVLLLVGGLLEAASLALLLPLIQLLAGADRVNLPATGIEVGLGAALLAIGIVVALRALNVWLTAVLGTVLRVTTIDSLRLEALDNVLRADWTWLVRQRRSAIVEATTTEMRRVEAALLLLLQVGTTILTLVATLTIGVLIAPALGAIAVAMMALLTLAGSRGVRRSLAMGIEGSALAALFGATVTDSLASLRLVRAHDSAGVWSGLLHDAAARLRRLERRYAELTAAVSGVVSILGIGVALCLVALGRHLGLSVAELVAFAVVLTRALTLARGLLSAAQTFAHVAPSIDAVRRITHDAAAHEEVDGAGALDGYSTSSPGRRARSPEIGFASVSAGYGDEPAFRDLSVTLAPGSFVAVTGPSGAGKSTLLDVLLGLLSPSSGTLLVGGTPLSDLTAWRAHLAYVPQQSVLIPGTVRANLTWSAGQTPVDDAAIWAALESAAAADVVRRLPDGLDTELHDAAQLSGGEQQRLCIARALVRQPQLLVLDEATSALDAATEEHVLAALRAQDATVVLATHRASAVAMADQVIDLTP